MRLSAAAGAAGFLGMNFGWSVALIWLTAALAAEALTWSSSKRFDQPPEASAWERLNHLFALTCAAAVWSIAAGICWFANRPGFTVIATLVAAGQLIHAQAFAFKSPVAFAAIAGIPTIMILVLPVLYGGLRDGDKASALAAVIMVLAYVAISARSNLKSAQALQQARVELRRFTFLDPLTALTNRRGFVDELGKRVTGANLSLSGFGLVRIDLNRLQDVNETIGHDAGDALLFASAQRLRAVTGPAASLSRTGGDDFALILGADIDETQGKRLCADILEAFTQPIAVKGVTVTVTPNIAVAWFPQDADDAEGLIKAADAALEEAQNAGRDPWRATASAA